MASRRQRRGIPLSNPPVHSEDRDLPAHDRATAGAGREAGRSVHLGIFGRSPPFTARQWKVFGIAVSAHFFDVYDEALLSLALRQIQRGLSIASADLGFVLAFIRMGYLGALLITPFADIFGRRRMLLYTIIGYTLFTLASAVAPDTRAFIIAQVFARAFAGAEVVVAVVIVAEEVAAGVRGWAIGLLGAIAGMGYGLASLVFGMINVMPYGWRGLYALAVVPLALIIPIRRLLPESRRFEARNFVAPRGRDMLAPLEALFRAYPGRLAIIVAVAFLGALGSTVANVFFPKFLQEFHHWAPSGVSILYVIGGAVGILGEIVVGWLSDRFGRRRVGSLVLFMVPLLTLWMYTGPDVAIVPAWVVWLFCYSASLVIVRAYGAELFPTSHRSTAASILLVAGTLGAAAGFALEGLLYGITGSHWIDIRFLAVVGFAAPVIVLFFFPETAGHELETIAPE